MTCILVVAALLGLTPGQSVGNQLRQQDALRSLSVSRPDVKWDAKSALSADFDCDGSLDEAFLGRAAGKVFVGLVRAAVKQPEILEFGVDPSAQAAICQEPATLGIESLNYDPTEEVGKIDGFRSSRRCKGLLLSGGQCDPIHLYWNYKTKHLAWWRP
jgi:hypothetical protein